MKSERMYTKEQKKELAAKVQRRVDDWKYSGGRVVQVEPGNSMLDELRVTTWFRVDPTNLQTFMIPCDTVETAPDMIFQLVREKLPLAGGYFERLKGDRQR